jgi:ABC-type uncharacterized transport system substrate-binding protein
MTYGQNHLHEFRRAAAYVVKILNGAKPADLPVEQATKFELIINMEKAKARGPTIRRWSSGGRTRSSSREHRKITRGRERPATCPRLAPR